MPFSTYRYLDGPVFDAMRREQEAYLHTINFYAVMMKHFETYVREWMDVHS
jgi:hypothetical protein